MLSLFSGCNSTRTQYNPKVIHRVGYSALYEDSGQYSLSMISAKSGLSSIDLKRIKAYWHINNDDLYCMSDKSLRKSLAKIERPKPSFPSEAAKFRMESLVNEDGVIPEGAYHKALDQVKKIPKGSGSPLWGKVVKASEKPGDLLLANRTAGVDPAGWTWLGPGNIGGRLRSCVIDPVNTDTMWVGSIAGGIWKTTDGGARWSQEDDFMTNLAVSCMVMDPTDPDTIYAGTGEGFGNSDALRGAGIFKTTDGGVTWNQLPSTTGPEWYYVNRLAVNRDGSVLLAGTNSALFRSTDGGATWRVELDGVGRVQDVKFDPNNISKAVASCSTDNVYYSTDGGQSWSRSSWDYPPTTTPRMELAYSGGASDVLWCVMDENSGDLYKSSDGGVNWIYKATTGHLNSQGWYDNVVWVDPLEPDNIYLGGVDLYRYRESLNEVARISAWQYSPHSAHADQHCIVPHPDFGGGGPDTNTVFFCNDGGIYKGDISRVNGDSSGTGWLELNNNLGTTQLYSAAGNSNSGIIIGGCQDNGTVAYSGGTESWTEIFGGDGGYCAFDQNDPDYCYGEYVYLAVFRNSAGGSVSADWSKDFINGNYWAGSGWSWKSAPYYIPDSKNNTAEFIAPFMLDPNLQKQNRMLAGGLQLWRTNDVKTENTDTKGPAWTSIKKSIGSSYTDNITAIAVAPGNSDIIWVGHRNGNVYKTTNGTETSPSWTRVDTNGGALPNRRVQSIAIDKNNNSTVYICFGGFSADNLYRTTDGGVSDWKSIVGSGSTQLPAAPVRTLAIHPNSSDWLYAGTEVGIFASSDGGSTWSSSNEGPTNCSVDQLFWMDNNGIPVLVAATHGRGVFKIEIPKDSSSLSIDNVSLLEGDASTTKGAVFTVSLSGATVFPVTVNYATTDNTATVTDGDYDAISTGQLSFDADGTKTVTVTVNGDQKNEEDETFYLDLSNAVNAAVTNARGVGTIINDDPEPKVSLIVDNAKIAEAGGSATFSAELSAVSGKDVTVDLAFSGTAEGNDTDYRSSGTQIVISAGMLTGAVTVTALQDALDEDNETVVVDIASVTNGTENGNQQQSTEITDDDPMPSVTFTPSSQASSSESGVMKFSADLSAVSGRDITVPFSISPLSTASGSDYSITGSPLIIPAGSKSATAVITITEDTTDEDDETVIVDMGTPVNASPGAVTTYTATITDDDTSMIKIKNILVVERDTGQVTNAQFTVSLSNESVRVITVDYATADGTATTTGGDYNGISGQLTFNPGTTELPVDITVNGDFIDEENETFTLNLSNAVNAAILNSSGTCAIIDDDTTYTLTVVNGTGSGSVVNGDQVVITADTSLPGLKFSEWTGDINGVADVNASPTTITMPSSSTTVTADFIVDPTTAEKITAGSRLVVYASEIPGMDAEFTRQPKIYGKYTDPQNSKVKRGNTKLISRVSRTAPANKIESLWNKNVLLYHKKDWKSANKRGTSTAAWLAGNPDQNSDLECKLRVQTSTGSKSKIDSLLSGTLIVPPEVTSITRWDGGSIAGGVHTKGEIIIKGNYFGIRAPAVYLEYLSADGTTVRQKKLKVLKPYKYADEKGREGKSCMDLNSTNGTSEVTVALPGRGWAAGTYSLILTNKIGIALDTGTGTIPQIIITPDENGSVPSANSEKQTLYAGERYYNIDILENDSDPDSDLLTIIPDLTGTTGFVKTGQREIRYYPPDNIDVSGAAFTDTFAYTLQDSSGEKSTPPASVTLTFNKLTLTSITRWDGLPPDAGGINPGALLILNGSDFGVSKPTVLLKNKADGESVKLKVYPPENRNYNGKADASYTDLSTGVSRAVVEFPKKWPWAPGTYTLEISNGIGGLDTTNLTLSSPSVNTPPTANDDTADILSGASSYLIDVLANDSDKEAEKVSIILGAKRSSLGAKLSIDKKTNRVRYTRAPGVLCPFTDTFTYTLTDSTGAESSGAANVTVNGNLNP
jgi:hypothetical protein